MLVLKSFNQILSDMIVTFKSKTGINDFRPGSVIATILESSASEDFSQYFKMLQIIRNQNLDTTEGDDLNNRAIEIMGSANARIAAQKASGYVKIYDESFSKIYTKIYSGQPGPVKGQTFLYINNSSGFSTSGSIIIGRGTNNSEIVQYTSIESYSTYYKINCSPLAYDHGADETVILKQGADRLISAGTVVRIPQSDNSFEVTFTLDEDVTLLTGENELNNVKVTATDAGTTGNAAIGSIIEFVDEPFDGAMVVNETSFINGSDEETDSQLRNRIKNYIQSLSRGTSYSIKNAVLNVFDSEQNKRVVSANLVDSIDLNTIPKLYIDDGTGFEPSYEGQGLEILINSASGGEKFLQLNNYPVIKAQLESTSEPFKIVDSSSLTINVGYNTATLTFTDLSENFKDYNYATAEEIVTYINNDANVKILIEARTSNNGQKIVIQGKAQTNENIQVAGSANNFLQFPTDLIDTIKLYKISGDNVTLLNKDGQTARIISPVISTTVNINNYYNFEYKVDGKKKIQVDLREVGDGGDYSGTYTTKTAVTLSELIIALKEICPGITISLYNTSQIIIYSNEEFSSSSSIQIYNAATNDLNSNFFGFSTSLNEGANKDYTLNRFNGQIELENELNINEKVCSGLSESKGFILSSGSDTFILPAATIYTLKIDSGVTQTIDLSALAGNTTSLLIVESINQQIKGATASVTSTGKIKIETNSADESYGSIQIISYSPSNPLGFTTEQKLTIKSHTAFMVSGVAENYTFGEDNNLIVILDNDTQNKTYNINMYLPCISTVTGIKNNLKGNISGLSVSLQSKFTNNLDLKGMRLRFTTGLNAATERDITSYDVSTGTIVLASDFDNNVTNTDEFLLIPKTAKNVVTFLMNRVLSSFSTYGKALDVNDGKNVQIESLTVGSEGAIQVSGGTANDILQFNDNLIQIGIDGYKYYTGLLRKIQRIVDGLEENITEYPGMKAAGVQIEVAAPTITYLDFNITIKTSGISLTTLSNDIKNKISNYINSLGISEDVILSELIYQILTIDGIVDAAIVSPTSNIIIADNEIARTKQDFIILSEME